MKFFLLAASALLLSSSVGAYSVVANANNEQPQEETYDAAPVYDDSVVPAADEEEAVQEEGSARAMQEFYDEDKESFIRMVNGLLWDQDFHEDVDEQARSMGYEEHTYRKSGLLGRPMPAMLDDEGTIAGQLYRGFLTRCYDISCRYGLQGLASSLESLFGRKK